MLTNDDLQAISKLLDEKSGPINSRLDIIELKQDRTSKKLDDLQLDVKIAERDVRREIHSLKDEMETV
ncbi:MAG: hypothetical protein Q4C58_15850 [Eubacteriales bacterium]|nr:hypothetical protein [Eubacteriales bacterium]